MADNIDVDPGTGAGKLPVATDDCGVGGHVQLVKIAYSADGVATLCTVDANGVLVNVGNASLAVTGTFWQATQPVSGTFWQATQPVSAASLPLPTGASTAAKQPALGTAGAASADVITVQGVASMTALKVDGSAVTQPVSGTFWQATQPVSGTFWQATQPVSLASVPSHAVTNAGTFAVQAASAGDVAHDGVDSGNPVKIGYRALAHGTNPTAVAAADRTDGLANRAGIPWVIGGHPNIVTIEYATTGAATDVALVTVGAGAKIIVTQIQAVTDEATTVGVGLRVGFGTANTPTTTGVVMTHPGMVPGAGVSRGDGSGILGIGADNEDLRITSEAPTSGSLRVLVSYYTIES